MSLIEGRLGCREASIENPPAVNVLEDADFKDRAKIIFDITDKILGMSFGPHGAPTLISDYPYMVATKDGFTIARYIQYDQFAGSPVDRVIFQMMMDICSRVNYAVGDGTTTAIMVTNQLYQSIMAVDALKSLPYRKILQLLNCVKDKIIEKFSFQVVMITPDNMSEAIHNIADISTNGDAEITDIITTAYDKYKYPVLRCEASEGSSTYLEQHEGYTCKVRLGDDIFINSSKSTGDYSKMNVLIFDSRVNARTYTDIIAPLTEFCKLQREHVGLPVKLVCIAPSYDETVLQLKIKQDIISEYKRSKSFDLIVLTYPKMNDVDKQSIADLAMLLNTEIIDRTTEQKIFDMLDAGKSSNMKILNILDVSKDNREISKLPPEYQGILNTLQENTEDNPDNSEYVMRVGYADRMQARKASTTFELSVYDKGLYEKFKEDAKRKLDEALFKYKDLGSHSEEIINAQYRYSALTMESATICVGGTSKLSKEMRLSAVEDAVRATESAYKNGYVRGCNVSMMSSISEVVHSFEPGTNNRFVAEAFMEAYKNVCKRLFDGYCEEDYDFDDIISAMIQRNTVLDMRTDQYSDKIINSAKTDTEILTAVVDLIGILLSGNQVILARYEHDTSK